MSNAEIIRSWKEPEYRESLSGPALSAMPGNPAGQNELSASQLRNRLKLTRASCPSSFVESCVTPPQQCP